MTIPTTSMTLHRALGRVGAALGLILLAAGLVLAASGCAGTGHRVGGSSLTQANAKAKQQAEPRAESPETDEEDDSAKGKRRRGDREKDRGRKGEREEPLRAGTRVYPLPPPPPETVVVVNGYGEPEYYEEEPEPWIIEEEPSGPPAVFTLGFAGSGSSFDLAGVSSNRSFSISAGAYAPVEGHRVAGEVEFSYGTLDFAPGLEGFRQGREYSIGATVKYSLTPMHTAVETYVLAGIRGGLTQWSYLTPLAIEDEFGGVYVVTGDWLPTVSPYVGFGVTLIKTPGFELGTSVRGGLQIWDDYTHAGLFNDTFGPTLFGQMRIELGIPLR